MREEYDTQTGEILSPEETHSRQEVQALVPATALTGGDIINQLRDGEMQVDFHTAVSEVVQKIMEIAAATGAKAKGSVTLKLDFTAEDSAIRIGDDIKIVLPKEPKMKSISWVDDNGCLTSYPPNQMRMLALKSAGGSGGIRNI